MKKKKILLVDDEVDFAQTLALHLTLHGFEVTLMHSGQEALEKVKDVKPDLMLLDVMMPAMDGFQVCAKMRQDDAVRHTPIIMLTAKRMVQDKVEGLKVGADDYITKSSEMEELFARIEAVLRRNEFSLVIEKEKATLIGELRDIIRDESLDIFFQPIVNLKSKKTIGYEVTAHGPKGCRLDNPERLFEFAYKFRPLRTRADQTHIAFKHIYQLWKLIEIMPPQKSSNPCPPRIILLRPYGACAFFSPVLHSPEFYKSKAPPVFSYSLLQIEYLTRGAKFDCDRYYQE